MISKIMEEENYNYLHSIVGAVVQSIRKFESKETDQYISQLCGTLVDQLESLVSGIKAIDILKIKADDLMLQLERNPGHGKLLTRNHDSNIVEDTSIAINKRKELEDNIHLYEKMTLENENKV